MYHTSNVYREARLSNVYREALGDEFLISLFRPQRGTDATKINDGPVAALAWAMVAEQLS